MGPHSTNSSFYSPLSPEGPLLIIKLDYMSWEDVSFASLQHFHYNFIWELYMFVARGFKLFNVYLQSYQLSSQFSLS